MLKARLKPPKEEILDPLPFLIGKAMLLCIADKFKREITTIVDDEDSTSAELKVL